jgi:hypothetical protein
MGLKFPAIFLRAEGFRPLAYAVFPNWDYSDMPRPLGAGLLARCLFGLLNTQ